MSATELAARDVEVSDALAVKQCAPKQRKSDGATIAKCPVCGIGSAVLVRRVGSRSSIDCATRCDGQAVAKALGLKVFDSTSASVPTTSLMSAKPSRSRPAANVVCLADVVPEKVTWLWPGRIPFGKLTVLDGDPGLGKSTLTLALAALVSTGRPLHGSGESREAASVVVVSLEDGLADTIAPRLKAAGADMARVHAFASIGPELLTPTLPGDLPELERIVVKVGAKLVTIDPLMAVLGGDVNAHVDQDVRRALAPLAAMADRTGAAVLIVRHLNKSTGGSAGYRGGGSVGIGAAARSVLLVAKDPNDPEGRVLASVKNNLASTPPSLRFGLVSSPEHSCAVVAWGEECLLTADELVAIPTETGEEGAVGEAIAWLKTELADAPMGANEMKAAASAAGITWATIKRAKQRAGVEARRVGFGPKGRWVSGIPPKEPNPSYWASMQRGSTGAHEQDREITAEAAPANIGAQPAGQLTAFNNVEAAP